MTYVDSRNDKNSCSLHTLPTTRIGTNIFTRREVCGALRIDRILNEKESIEGERVRHDIIHPLIAVELRSDSND